MTYTLEEYESRTEFIQALKDMPAEDMNIQLAVLQGGINVCAQFLRDGYCNENAGWLMLAELRDSAALLRKEAVRRGITLSFQIDQTGFQ